MAFADRLRELREGRGLSRQELANATDLSIHTITSYEKGRRQPNAQALTTLERYFQVSGDFLCGNIEKTVFLENSSVIQNSLDNLISLFQTFKAEFDCSSQDRQLLSVSILNNIMQTVICEILQDDHKADLNSDEVCSIFQASFSLNAAGLSELSKRAEELTQLPQYKK